jgi:Mg2+ and Co2+ transporter CorA
MEIDVRDEETNNNNKQSTNGASKLIDTINNNINCLFDKLSESETKIDADESSLPSPKAMLETIMPCEKLCNSFRQIADDIGAGGEVIKTHIKHEISEPKLASDGEDFGSQFPLNLKSLRHGSDYKQGMNVSGFGFFPTKSIEI